MSRTLTTWAVAAMLSLAGCKADAPSEHSVPTMTIEGTETFVREIRAEGTLQAVEATPLTAPQDSQRPMKIAWVAEGGTIVAQGDVVVRFDPSEMERELQNSRDDVTMAELEIDKVRAQGAASRHKRDVTEDLAHAEASAAREFESADEEIFSRHEILESSIDIDLAEAKAEHARDVKKIESAVSKNQVELHGISRGHATREVQRAREGLEKLEVTAPHAGIVVLERGWRGETVRVGDTVWPGQPIAELPLVSRMQAELFVLESDAGNLAEGLPAELVVEAHPEKVYEGRVKSVDTLAKPRHANVPVHYLGLVLELEHTDTKTMRVGQRVHATIRVEEPEAIVVPRQAIFDRDGKTMVYRQQGHGFELVEVKLGVASAGRVVIETGLQPGDRIALRDPTRSTDEIWTPEPPGKAGADGGDKGAV